MSLIDEAQQDIKISVDNWTLILIAAQAKGKEDLKGKEALVNRTIAALNREIKNFPSDKEGVRLANMASRLSAKLSELIPKFNKLPVPGCCYYTGKDYLKNVVAIAEKQERVENAMMQLKATPSENPKVKEYFQNALMKLKKGENVPLPDFYHATRALEGVITSQTIRQSIGGAAGPGTYMSCNNEGDIGYGPHAFAIDEGCLVDTSANTFTGRQPYNPLRLLTAHPGPGYTLAFH